jgi:hypothetical protein
MPPRRCQKDLENVLSEKLNPKWKPFIEWLNTPELYRGAVTTEEEWGAANGVTSRTMRRWKGEPAFIALRESLSASMVDTSTPMVGDAPAGSDKESYDAIKAKLVEGARSGNPKSLDLYFRTYGKPFVEEEVAARSLDLSAADLPELVAYAVASLAPEELEEALAKAGWHVERPAGG